MKARVKVDLDRQIGRINRNIYGQFMCRRPGCSEGGLYDPASSTADEYGLRGDVVQFVEDLQPPIIRWPGGCTGTSYHWLDGVGPVEERPQKIDLHFGWPANYEFGTHEFISFCRRIGAEPHLNFAMGTGTLDDAAAWVEYCNGTHDTYYANLRRRHGYEQPYNVKYWQLGNEMYGPWEIGYCSAEDYGVQAREWAKVLRRLDRSISIVAVGGGANSSFTPEWAWEVVPQVCPYVDYISVHDYWRGDPEEENWYQLLAGPHRTEQVIEDIATVIRLAHRRNAHSRQLSIAVTEWNGAPTGGMMAHHPEYHPFAPTYCLRDALAVASFINIMQRHCREVTLANIAQTINVVGLIMVTPEGVWREPVDQPLWMQVQHSGSIALDAWVDCDTFDEPSQRLSGLSYLDCSATLDPEQRKLFLSLVNRHRHEAIEVDIALIEAAVMSQGAIHLLHNDDAMAMNSPGDPDKVKPTSQALEGASTRFIQELKPHSYTIVELNLA